MSAKKEASSSAKLEFWGPTDLQSPFRSACASYVEAAVQLYKTWIEYMEHIMTGVVNEVRALRTGE